MTAIYRGMSRAELDRAYSPSSMVPSIEPFLVRYAEASAAARAALDPIRRQVVRYGEGAAHTLDLFRPAAETAPLLLFIHGGYWQALSKLDASFPAPAITAAGFGYAAVDYTLAPAATLDEIVAETRAAIAHLWHERAALGIGERGIVIAGHSAGAHLAAMALVTKPDVRDADPAFIKGAVLIGGVYDLEPIHLTYVNDPLRLDAASARRNSPLYLTPTTRMPLIVTWAERDTDEFKRQSRELAIAWGPYAESLVTFEQGGNHFDCLFDWCDPRSRLFAETTRLLSR